jgi:hypothetical protein
VQTFRRFHGLPINQLWQSVRNSAKPGRGERWVLAGAVSLALFAWGLREIRQAL